MYNKKYAAKDNYWSIDIETHYCNILGYYGTTCLQLAAVHTQACHCTINIASMYVFIQCAAWYIRVLQVTCAIHNSKHLHVHGNKFILANKHNYNYILSKKSSIIMIINVYENMWATPLYKTSNLKFIYCTGLKLLIKIQWYNYTWLCNSGFTQTSIPRGFVNYG